MTDNIENKLTVKEKKDPACKKYRAKKRAALNLTIEQMEELRKQKIAAAVSKRYKEGFVNTPPSKEAKENRAKIMSEKMTTYHANRTKEERKETTMAAHIANEGSKRSDESKDKMSTSYKKYKDEYPEEFAKRYEKRSETMLSRSNEEIEVTKQKRSASMEAAWIKPGNELISDKRNKTISKKLTGRKRSPESIAKQVQKITGRTLSDAHKKACADANRSDGTVKSKWYDVQGIRCQGGSEKIFVEMCIRENKKVIGHPVSIKTPFGYYRPDFVVDGQMIEVKSSWTYKQFLDKPQYKKVKWICDNFVPVDIWVVDSNDNMKKVTI